TRPSKTPRSVGDPRKNALLHRQAGAWSSWPNSLAVWLRAGQRVVKDVKVADDWHEKRVVNSDSVGDVALCQRNYRSSYDRHVEDSGTISGQRTEFSQTESENAREHNGIEKPHGKDAPHRGRAASQHGGRYKRGGTNRA